jgi:hypothetical protein
MTEQPLGEPGRIGGGDRRQRGQQAVAQPGQGVGLGARDR